MKAPDEMPATETCAGSTGKLPSLSAAWAEAAIAKTSAANAKALAVRRQGAKFATQDLKDFNASVIAASPLLPCLLSAATTSRRDHACALERPPSLAYYPGLRACRNRVCDLTTLPQPPSPQPRSRGRENFFAPAFLRHIRYQAANKGAIDRLADRMESARAPALVQERDLIARTDRALDQHGAVHAHTPLVRLRDDLQDLRAGLPGVGI